jgi:DNA-binding NtrC family response regulator
LARLATYQPHILLAEDEPGIMFTFKAILEEAGFLVDSASNFEGAKKAIANGNYDAVITDFSLEREGLGLELAREAKQRHPAPAILVYSGDPTVERLRHALALPVDYFAFKPIDLDEIKVAIARLVARRAEALPRA